MEKKTARQYLDQFPNAKPEKEIDWLGFATDYASQESEPLKDKIKELEGEYTELRRKLHKESDRLFTVSFIRDLDQKVSKGDISYSRMIEILNEKVTLQKIDIVNDNKLLYESNCKEREVKQNLSDTNVQLQSELTRMRDGLALIFNEIEHIMDDELTTAESKIKEVTESLLSTKQETNQDPRSAGIDKIYSGLSDIQRSNPMPYDDSNKILTELLKIRDSLVKIKSLTYDKYGIRTGK